MVQATAWFTEMDIQIVMTTGMPEEPFIMVGGNLDNRAKDCPGFPMWIGYKNTIQYQSLLPSDDEVPYPRSCRKKNNQEAQDTHSHKEEQPGDKIPKKKTNKENTKLGYKILNNNEQNATGHQEEGDQQESSQKRKYQCESNEPAKVIKSGEGEAFLFKEGNRVYRCVAESEGYQCCMCPNVFSQIGRHISSSKCGETLDVKRFKAELKKYFDKKKMAKNRAKTLAENSTEYRQKDAQRYKEVREKKMAQNSKECRQKGAEKQKESRNKKLVQNSEECRQKEAEKEKISRNKKLVQNSEECRQKEAEKQKESRNKKLVQNSKECRKKLAEKQKESRIRKLVQNSEECRKIP